MMPAGAADNLPSRMFAAMAGELPRLLNDSAFDFKVQGERTAAIKCGRESILELCRQLKDRYAFEHLSLISAVDLLDRFQLVYHLASYQNHSLLEIKIDVPKEDPKVKSVTPLWGGANWHEREAYDMMGIVFEGHPDMRRILLPQDYKYFPLRKDFKMED
jgi:NADH-quinone oxidoreductase subunit C